MLDTITAVLSAMFAHVRGLPMFATLLGFGIGLITMSLWRRGYPALRAQRVLWRRYGWLAGIGVLHCVFLFYGDIIVLYSVLALVVISMLRMRNRTLVIIACSLLALGALGGVVLAFAVPSDFGSMSGFASDQASSYPGYLLWGFFSALGYLTLVPLLSVTNIFPIMILGFVAARVGIHLNPNAHLRLLRALIGVAVLIIVGIGLPWGLSTVGVLPESWAHPLSVLNNSIGFLTGPGILAGILLACRPMQRRVDAAYEAGEKPPAWPLPVRMVIALGKRSMSGYILQSVFMFTLMLPFTFNVGEDKGAFVLLLIAFGVWLATVVCAWLMEVAGSRGPVEALHRRLAYGQGSELPARFELPPAQQPQQAPTGLPVEPAPSSDKQR
ncbi:DUF418 domain-containing protein [Corynebacterium uterequi]|nr:DUF418 domain-containing protein [Corynebacterium uterequi]